MNRRVIIFIIIFAIITAIFVPLLSLYGLRVCPVLSIPGFGFGCYYSGIFIFFVNVLNIGLIFALHKKTPETNDIFNWFKRNRLVGFVCIYIAATMIALALLQILLHVNHLTSNSRAPEILGFASLLIGIFQAYGLNWALIDTPAISEIPGSFRKLWGLHVLRTMLPLALTVAITLHFLFSQSISFNDGSTAPIVDHDVMIEQTSYVVSFLFFWLLLTFTFHFLAERDQVKKIQIHLNHLNNMDFKFKSNFIHVT